MSIRPVSIPYATDKECSLCLTNPFEEDLTMSSHSWNGHSVSSGAAETERKIIHGICSECLPKVPRNKAFLKCYECTLPFPDGRRSQIVVKRDGSLISETLLPPIENQDAYQNFGGAFPTGPCSFLSIGATSTIAYIAATLVASSTTTTYLVPGAHLAVRLTVWTPTVMVATLAQPVLLSVSLGVVVMGILACLGEAVRAEARQREA